MSYTHEYRVACLAVQRATLFTQRVFHQAAKGTQAKDDASPVTIGDYGAQALINAAIKHNFPKDEIVGEEEASSLRANPALQDEIWKGVRETRLQGAVDDELGGTLASAEAMAAAIDAGNSAGGPKGRFWTVDPIDGTKGFLRGGQYAVCLALVDNGEPVVGVLGCPNLPVEQDQATLVDLAHPEPIKRGLLVSAVQGQGAEARPLGDSDLLPAHSVHVRQGCSAKDLTFTSSVEKGHSSQSEQAQLQKLLNNKTPPLQMDSQAKYACVARGVADVYLRLPIARYVQRIWDHAPGDLILREAGGSVSDQNGNRLDFGQGRTLTKNECIIGCVPDVHMQVLDALRTVLARKV